MKRLLSVILSILIAAPALAGTVVHRDYLGNRIGKTVTDGNRTTTYDRLGNRTGSTTLTPHGKTNFDYLHNRTGSERDGVVYDRSGRKIGSDKLVK